MRNTKCMCVCVILYFMTFRPSTLLHDHDYTTVRKKTSEEGATINGTGEGEVVKGEGSVQEKKEDPRYCILCCVRGDQPLLVSGERKGGRGGNGRGREGEMYIMCMEYVQYYMCTYNMCNESFIISVYNVQ